jgi:hypothetical protein
MRVAAAGLLPGSLFPVNYILIQENHPLSPYLSKGGDPHQPLRKEGRGGCEEFNPFEEISSVVYIFSGVT